jgi:hypothetical protein
MDVPGVMAGPSKMGLDPDCGSEENVFEDEREHIMGDLQKLLCCTINKSPVY